MQPIQTRLAFALCILSIHVPFVNSGETNSQSEKPKTDKYGDPLPKGAVARIGTVRFLHPGVGAVAISPDGKLVASGGYGGKIRIWDAATGRELQKIVSPDSWFARLQFTPDGRTLAAICGHEIRAWDKDTEKMIWSQTAIGSTHNSFYGQCLTFGKNVLVSVHSGSLNCTLPDKQGGGKGNTDQKVIRMWNSRTGKQLALAKALKSTDYDCYARIPLLFHAVAVSPDAKLAAVVVSAAHPVPVKDDYPKWKYNDRRLRIVDLASGNVVREIEDKHTKALAFSGDGQTLAVANDTSIQLLRIRDGQKRILVKKLPAPIRSIQFAGRTGILTAVLNGEDNNWLSDDEQNILFCWDIKRDVRISRYDLRANRHVSFSRDGGRMATAQGNTVRVRHTRTGKILGGFFEHPSQASIRFLPNAPSVLITETSREFSLWKARTSQRIKSFQLPKQESLSWHVDLDQRIQVVRNGNRWVVKELSTGRVICNLEGTVRHDPIAVFSAAGNRVAVKKRVAMNYSQLGHYIKSKFQMFNVADGKKIAQFRHKTFSSFGFKGPDPIISLNGRYVVDNLDGIVILNVDNNRLVAKLGHANSCWHGFSTDEKYLLGQCHGVVDGKAKLFALICDVQTGQIARKICVSNRDTLRGIGGLGSPNTWLDRIALSPDNRLMAVVPFNSKSIHIWEVLSGQKRGEFCGHLPEYPNDSWAYQISNSAFDLAFSPDGKYLGSSCNDKTILIWDLHRPFTSQRFAEHLSAKQLADHWQTLAERNAKNAEAAFWGMIYASKDAVPFLSQRLHRVPPHDDKRLDRLIHDLDGGFRTRTKAFAEIQKLGELALPRLHEESQKKNNLERHRRLQLLLKHAEHDRIFGNSDRLRLGRALEVLEKIGNTDARQLLQRLGGGAESAWLTREANAALQRLRR